MHCLHHANRHSPLVLARSPSRDLTRRGCRVRAYREVLAACPARVAGQGPCSHAADDLFIFSLSELCAAGTAHEGVRVAHCTTANKRMHAFQRSHRVPTRWRIKRTQPAPLTTVACRQRVPLDSCEHSDCRYTPAESHLTRDSPSSKNRGRHAWAAIRASNGYPRTARD